jgi:hypothetical protein
MWALIALSKTVFGRTRDSPGFNVKEEKIQD